ncbi:MAG: carboxypeptidase-like regulatory domain-containing protein [Bacteroidales bacterium]|jgi:hypothetical protein|nr:carboxypeptidase-like regulatory domain-containing protein [Bacteroidales bacterium]
MKKLTTLFAFIIFSSSLILASNVNEEKESTKKSESAVLTTSLSGIILDKTTGEALVGVKVMVDGTEKAAYTDFEGNFEIKELIPGNHQLKASLISYKEKKENIQLDLTQSNTIELTIENISE